MTIWINNPFDFLPGEGGRLQRYGLLAKALIKAGHAVVWWTSDWNHIKKAVRQQDPESAPAGLDIRLIRTMPYFKNVGFSRLISHGLYARDWQREALKVADNVAMKEAWPDLIICSLPPLETGWILRRLCRRFGCKGVVDVMDLWPETFERVFPRWMLWPLRCMAKRIYGDADGLSAVGERYLEQIKGTYAQAGLKPMHVCYHGIEMPVLMEKGSSAQDGLRLLYLGNMGQGYDLKTVVSVVRKLIEQGHPLQLDLAGEGDQLADLEALAVCRFGKEAGKAPIRFHGVVKGAAMEALLRHADIGLIPMFPDTGVAVPYKLADYAAYGVPVISSLSGETRGLIERYGAGWGYEAGHEATLETRLKACLEQRQNVDAARRNARRMAEECFDAGVIYPQFVNWLEELVGGTIRTKDNLKRKGDTV